MLGDRSYLKIKFFYISINFCFFSSIQEAVFLGIIFARVRGAVRFRFCAGLRFVWPFAAGGLDLFSGGFAFSRGGTR